MPYEFKMKRMVEFAETDMAGIMHFSNYFRYMEATEHAFFRTLGERVHGNDGGSMLGWARVHAECRYAEPLRYEDAVEVHLLVRAKTEKALTYDFAFRKSSPDAGDHDGAGRIVARGSVTVVCVRRAAGETDIRSAPMPPAIAERIEVAPPDLIEHMMGKDQKHAQ